MQRSTEFDGWMIRTAREGQSKYKCPFCHHTHSKANQGARDLTMTRDFERIVYYCHRCTQQGIVPLRDTNVISFQRKEEPRAEVSADAVRPLERAHLDWLLSRRIPAQVAADYKLFASQPISGQPTIGFPYFSDKGKINAVKRRSVAEKKFLCWQAPISFFGIEQVPVGADLIIVEGEMDVLALAAAGIRAVSVPNGAPSKLSDDVKIDDTKFRYLWNAKQHIDKAPKVYIATDDDGPGNILAEELARRIGRAKCWRIKFPHKDANECLIQHGEVGLNEAIKAAEPWPVEGLFDASHYTKSVQELYDQGMGRGAFTGYMGVDELYSVVPGQMTVVTGIPSSGKSEFIDQLMINLAEQYSWAFGICSFENEPRLHIAKLASKRLKMPFFSNYNGRRMSKTELDAALDWIDRHFVFVHQDNGDLSTLDSILDRLKAAVLRYGIRGAVIDPYNYISRPRDMSETDWVSEMLTRIKVFASSHGVHVWFVAHPTKLKKNETTGRIPPPGGYDISGSGAWFAKADCGMTIHREKDEPYITQVHIWKVRFQWVGKQGEARLTYDTGTTTYNDIVTEEENPKASEFL